MADDKKKEEVPLIGIADNEMLTDYLENLRNEPDTPEKEAKLRRLFQAYPELQAIAGEDIALGNEWLQTQMPEGRQAGDRYIAANPLEFLGAALRQGAGAYQRKNAMDDLRELAAAKTEGVMDVGRNAAAYQGITNTPPVGGYNLGDMKPPMRENDLSGLEAGGMAGYTPPQDVQPTVAQQAAKAEIADEALDPLDDFGSLRAAALRSQAQQQQASANNPQDLRIDGNFNVYEGLPRNLQNQPIGMNPFMSNLAKKKMARDIFWEPVYTVPQQKQVPIGYRRR